MSKRLHEVNLDSTIKHIPFLDYAALQEYKIAEEGICSAHRSGYSHWYVDLSLASESADTWDKKRIANLQTLINQLKTYPIMHGDYKAPLSSELEGVRVAAVEHTKKEIQLASQFSAPLIIHAGAIVEPRLVKQAKEKALDNFLLSLNELTQYAKEYGVELWLENLSNYKKNHPFYYIFTTPTEFDYILSRCPDVKFFMDIGHANIGNDNIPEIIKRFHSRIIGISISNNDGVRDQHISLYKGTLDYNEIISTLLELDWSGYIGIEARGAQPSDSLLQISSICQKIASHEAVEENILAL